MEKDIIEKLALLSEKETNYLNFTNVFIGVLSVCISRETWEEVINKAEAYYKSKNKECKK